MKPFHLELSRHAYHRFTMSEDTRGEARRAPDPESGAEIGLLLRRAHVRAAQAFSAALEPLSIEGRHFAVLNNLDHHPRSQRELVELIGSDKASMVRLIDDLEAKRLVRRDPAPRDRRSHAVTLTDEGTRALAEARRTAGIVATQLLAHMPPHDQAALIGLLSDFVQPTKAD
jgi:DNA-binding MarR family transcriptional regulator